MSKSQANVNKQLSSLSPDVLVELFEIDFSNMQSNFEQLKDLHGINVGAESVYRFCGMINETNPIIWQGKPYQPLPISAEGFEGRNDGRFARPRLTIANPDGIFSRIIYNNSDFVGCKVTRKRTYVGFLDDENFRNKNLNSDGKNPFGQSDQEAYLPDDIYIINRKSAEDKHIIQFELTSPLDMDSAVIPARMVFSEICSWSYRCEIGCGYTGLPIETSKGQDLTKNFAFNKNSNNRGSINPADYDYPAISYIREWSKYGKNSNSNEPMGYNVNDIIKIIDKNSDDIYKRAPKVFVCIQDHSNPADHHPFFDKEHWAKDECSKTLEACKKRFSNPDGLGVYNQYKNLSAGGLRFGGFPGTLPYGHG
jgi:lambda family phage minor tail protein L